MINCIYITPKKGGVCIPGKLLTWASYGIIQNTILIIFIPVSYTHLKAGKTYYIAECTQDGTSQTIGALADGTVYEAVFGLSLIHI